MTRNRRTTEYITLDEPSELILFHEPTSHANARHIMDELRKVDWKARLDRRVTTNV
jgi:hypothetical protein